MKGMVMAADRFELEHGHSDAERAAEAVAAKVYENYKQWLHGERAMFLAHFPVGLYKDVDDDVQTLAHANFVAAIGGVVDPSSFAVEVSPDKKLYRRSLTDPDTGAEFHIAYASNEKLLEF